MIKRGLTWHNWCSRWCVLRWSTLTYFKSPSVGRVASCVQWDNNIVLQDPKPKGLFHLQGCEVEEYLPSFPSFPALLPLHSSVLYHLTNHMYQDAKKPFTFTVQSRNRLWYFQATSQNEQRSWMQAIRSAAQVRRKYVLSSSFLLIATNFRTEVHSQNFPTFPRL